MIDKDTLLKEIEAGPAEALRMHRGNDVPLQILRNIAADSPSRNVQIFLANYEDTPSRILEDMFDNCKDLEVLSGLADNPRTPKTVLQHLAKNDNAELRKVVARSKVISPQTAILMCDDPAPEIRAELAANPAIMPRVQIRLSEDEVPFVRASLLRSSRLDEEVYSGLADDVDPCVQAQALLSPRMPADVLLKWADSDEHFAQAILLERKNIPDNVLESLCFSSHPDIQKAAVTRKNLTLDEMIGFAKKGDVDVRLKIAATPNLPELVQKTLAKDENKEVRLAVASCPLLCKDAANILIADGDDDVKLKVALNMNAPEEVLLSLVDIDNANLQKAMISRKCPGKILERIYEVGNDEVLYHLAYSGMEPVGMPAALAGRLAESDMPSLRALAAACPDLPLYIGAKLSVDESAMVRLSLAKNRSASLTVLDMLAEDADSKVRAAAVVTRNSLHVEKDEEPEQSEPVQQTDENIQSEEEAPEEASDGGKKSLLGRLLGKIGI